MKQLILLVCLFAAAASANSKSVWEQVTGTKPPVEIKVPTVRDVTKDPLKIIVNPTSYINPTGIPTAGDFTEHVIKNPDQAIELLQNLGQLPYAPVATAIISGRNAVIQNGASPMPDNIKQALRRWYPDDLLNSVRWSTNWSVVNNTLQAAQMQFNPDTQAITLINAIVFRDSDAATSVSLWAHEVFHVEQYRKWGVFGFAKKWVDNSSTGGPVEAPAYARQRDVERALGAQHGTTQMASSLPGANFQLPQPWMQCIFPGDNNASYFVTVDNRIVAFPRNGTPPVFIGFRVPPRFPQFAWTYQTNHAIYDVTGDGRIFAPINGGVQVGHLAQP